MDFVGCRIPILVVGSAKKVKTGGTIEKVSKKILLVLKYPVDSDDLAK